MDKKYQLILSNIPKCRSKVQSNYRILEKICEIISKYHLEFNIEIAMELIISNDNFKNIVLNVLNNYGIETKNNSINILLKACNLLVKSEKNINDEEKKTDYEYTGDDSFRWYLNSISHKLLTAEEEKQLFLRYKNGDTSAKDSLITHNLRLVVSIAKKYVNRGVEFLDLIQEGNTGLFEAVDRFDLSKNCRFSTYATTWIEQRITRTLANNSRTIRIPVHVHEKIRKLKVTKTKLSVELGREPTIMELAKEMKLSYPEVEKIIKASSIGTISFDMPVGDDEDTALSDFIQDDEQNVEDRVEKTILAVEMYEKLKNILSEKQLYVITLRYGLHGSKRYTLEEIGKRLGVTRERVRQIENKSLKKISRNYDFKQYIVYAANPKKAEQYMKNNNYNISCTEPKRKYLGL